MFALDETTNWWAFLLSTWHSEQCQLWRKNATPCSGVGWNTGETLAQRPFVKCHSWSWYGSIFLFNKVLTIRSECLASWKLNVSQPSQCCQQIKISYIHRVYTYPLWYMWLHHLPAIFHHFVHVNKYYSSLKWQHCKAHPQNENNIGDTSRGDIVQGGGSMDKKTTQGPFTDGLFDDGLFDDVILRRPVRFDNILFDDGDNSTTMNIRRPTFRRRAIFDDRRFDEGAYKSTDFLTTGHLRRHYYNVDNDILCEIEPVKLDKNRSRRLCFYQQKAAAIYFWPIWRAQFHTKRFIY